MINKGKGKGTTEAHQGNPIPQFADPGRFKAMLDLGSIINIGGSQVLNALLTAAQRHDLISHVGTVVPPHEISGFGECTHFINTMLDIPIAMHSCPLNGPSTVKIDKAKLLLDDTTPDLPLILGSEWMVSQNAVLILQKGQEKFMIPGPGGYKILWSEGTTSMSMVNTEDGHLAIEVDHYDTFDALAQSESEDGSEDGVMTTSTNMIPTDPVVTGNSKPIRNTPTTTNQAGSSSTQEVHYGDRATIIEVHYEQMPLSELEELQRTIQRIIQSKLVQLDMTRGRQVTIPEGRRSQ